jgi:hypothetical protein
MLTPLFGGSFTAPVSPAPDLPSRTTGDYQDPIDDTNQSYRDLQDSLTADDEMLLGSVPDPIAAPAEMQPINYPTDPGAIDDMIGDAYENASGRCPPSVDSDGGFHDRCVAAAASPNFEQKMNAEVGLEVIKGFNQLAELWGGAAALGLGATALLGCALSVVCAGALAASAPEGAAFTPWIYSAMLARGLGLLGGAAAGAAGRPGAAGGVGSVTRNALNPAEFRQAQAIVDFRGGRFDGAPRSSFPGVDGWLDGTPVSLKAYSGQSPAGVLRHASSAETSARNAGYAGVTLYVDAPNLSASRLIDFATNGPLSQISRQGTIDQIYGNTRDGWILLP